MAAEDLFTFVPEGILKRVALLAAELSSYASGFKAEITKIGRSVSLLQQFLICVNPHSPSPVVKDWMEKLKDIALDAEEVLDEVQYEVLRARVEMPKRKVLNFFSTSSPLVNRLKMSHKIRKINSSLLDLMREASSFGLVAIGTDATPKVIANKGTLEGRRISGHNDEKMFGREALQLSIVRTLTNSKSQENLSVIVIEGMQGMGKTTLAHSIFREGVVDRFFDVKIWHGVSGTFNINLILHEMLESVGPTEATVNSQGAVLENLRRKLTGKRYILVLDDVWDEDELNWSNLKSCLSELGSLGSIVIVTTSRFSVAFMTATRLNLVFHLERLSEDECLSILKARVFDDSASMTPYQERILKAIVKKCEGIPLMAKVIGSMLCSKKTGEWLSILESRIWDSSKGVDRIMSAFKSGFDNLKSPALKQCFASCLLFPKGFKIERDNLIQLWMAQGLLLPSSDESMEEVGNQYFDILMESSLFEDATKDEYGIITNCKMCDLVHDLAEMVSQHKNLVPDFWRIENTAAIQRVARIPTLTLERIPKISVRRLQSLFSNSKVPTSSIGNLRFLNLYETAIEELPSSIDKLIHLRYLDISKTNIRALPRSVGKLYNLQTLTAHNTKYLEKFPKEMQNLINLRHLCFDKKMEFPVGMRQLTHLQTLPYFTVGEEMEPGIEELGGLNQLKGELTIYNLELVRDGKYAKEANLEDKENLSKLRFVWMESRPAGNKYEEDVLEGLKPHGKLKDLKIENFMGDTFPSWMMSRSLALNNLKKIQLGNCSKCEGVPVLGYLPNLRHLEIDGMANLKYVGVEFYGSQDVYDATTTSRETMALFPALQTLRILRCKELIEWMEAPVMSTEKIVVFPCLEELYIWFCPKLRNAPSHFPSLKKLDINHVNMPIANIICSKLTTLSSLNINHVQGLTHLPEGMLTNNKNLTSLKVRDCKMLSYIAPDLFGCCASLRSLVIDGCEELRCLPDGLDALALEELTIRHCNSLEVIPIRNGFASVRVLRVEFCDRLSSLPSWLEYCALQELVICGCRNLTSIPIAHDMALTSLRTCIISGCPQLSGLPSRLGYCTSLQELEISYCPSLAPIPFRNGLALKSLRICIISGCPQLSSLPSGLEYCNSLREMEISYCPRLASILFACTFPFLHELEIRDCDELSSLPVLEFCPSLQKLSITKCPKLTSLSICICDYTRELSGVSTLNLLESRLGPEIISDCNSQHFLIHLKDLRIGGFWEELDSFPSFQVGSQLETLWLLGWPKLKSLPQQIQHFTSLTSLWIGSFNGVEAFPEWLGNLTSLESLIIENCGNLMYLPTVEAMQRLTNLQELVIFGCPLLEERCNMKSGPEWPKIAHIPRVSFS